MSITIVKENCLGCECCVTSCRRRIFGVDNRGEIKISSELLPLCMHCGHCAAVCPGEAINLDGIAAADLEEAAPRSVAPEAILNFLKSKRSVGAYASREVPQDILSSCLDAANYAPSARGAHPVRWWVVSGRQKLDTLLQEMLPFYAAAEDVTAKSHYENYKQGFDSLLRSAPCVILACAPKHVYGASDCAVAITYLSLALEAYGVASCWAGSVMAASRDQKPQSLNIPKELEIYAAIMAGYPDVNFLKIPHRPKPRVTFV